MENITLKLIIRQKKHYGKHIESNIAAIQRRATIKQFITNAIKCSIQINFEKEKTYLNSFETMKTQTHSS